MSKAGYLAQNNQESSEVVELNRVLPLLSEEDIPDWLPLVPAGEKLTGRDGREFLNSDPEELLTNQRERGLDVPIDLEHATEIKGPAGEAAPAHGWLTEFKIENGVLLGRPEWNDAGKEALASNSYRYYSPAYRVNREREILYVKSVGLTNVPNLALPALNSESDSEGGEMKVPKAILDALELNAEAGEADVVAAIGKLKTGTETNTQAQGDLVPKADYEVVLNRATKAEVELNGLKEADLKARAEGAVGQAIKDGKIAPASKEYHLAHCNSEEGLKAFIEFAGKAPVTVEPNSEQAPPGTPENKTELNAEEAEVARQFGYTDEEAREVFGKKEKDQ